MEDKAYVVLLAFGAFVYNFLTPGQPPISPELIFTSAFGYFAGSAVGFVRGKNGNGSHKPAA